MNVPTWLWVVTLVIITIIFTVDLLILGRRPHEPSRREVTVALSIYISMAISFGIGVWIFSGGQYAGEFFAGWLMEYSLSIDNLFVFLLIMSSFGVPRKYQQYALMVGIVMALIMRAFFIVLGAAAIERWSWVFYIFGAFLIYTAINLARQNVGHSSHDEEDYKPNVVLRFVQKHFSVTESWDGGTKLRIVESGKRVLTPMFIVILALGTADLIFALDSIPAIFGLTREPYLVLMANVFALMGLRQLYFLLGDLLKRLVYLGLGLSVLLAFIGVKLVLHAMHENQLSWVNNGEPFNVPEIPIWLSLTAIIGILGVTAIASIIKSRLHARRGRGPKTPSGEPDEEVGLKQVSGVLQGLPDEATPVEQHASRPDEPRSPDSGRD